MFINLNCKQRLTDLLLTSKFAAKHKDVLVEIIEKLLTEIPLMSWTTAQKIVKLMMRHPVYLWAAWQEKCCTTSDSSGSKSLGIIRPYKCKFIQTELRYLKTFPKHGDLIFVLMGQIHVLPGIQVGKVVKRRSFCLMRFKTRLN